MAGATDIYSGSGRASAAGRITSTSPTYPRSVVCALTAQRRAHRRDDDVERYLRGRSAARLRRAEGRRARRWRRSDPKSRHDRRKSLQRVACRRWGAAPTDPRRRSGARLPAWDAPSRARCFYQRRSKHPTGAWRSDDRDPNAAARLDDAVGLLQTWGPALSRDFNRDGRRRARRRRGDCARRADRRRRLLRGRPADEGSGAPSDRRAGGPRTSDGR